MASAADDKVMEDLATLEERITLCNEMMKECGGNIESDEALLDVVGFLEACMPRIIELIEAASQGVLSEVTLMRCLEVNDKLLSVLSTNSTPAEPTSSFSVASQPVTSDLLSSPPPPPSLAASAAAADPFAGSDLLLQPSIQPSIQPSVGGLKSTGDDDFDSLLKPAAGDFKPAGSGKPPAVLRGVSGGAGLGSGEDPFATLGGAPQGLKSTKSDDLFDDFVGNRKM